MKVLIRQVKILSPSSPHNGQTMDMLIVDGIINKISKSINEHSDLLIEEPGLFVSNGWLDVIASFPDPGQEFKETLDSGARAAAAGGFTDVLVLPNTNPAVHNKSQVEYIVQRSNQFPVSIHPIGAISKNTEGKELAEMYDMRLSGAKAFSDGINAVQSPGLLLKALQYVQAFDGMIIQLPRDKSIGTQGLINEGITSTQLGLPGLPAIAEELMIARDIELVKYTGSRIHFTGISTKKGMDLIFAAKADGLNVSFSVTPYHGIYCDEDLVDYDTNLKTDPPLRSRADMMAIREAILAGKVDCLASHHMPQDTDSKICEFEYAKNGMIGLETVFSLMMTIGCSLEVFISMQENARQLFDIPTTEIKEGEMARLSIFNPVKTFVLETTMLQSRSRNTPFIGKPLKGQVKGIINAQKNQFNY